MRSRWEDRWAALTPPFLLTGVGTAVTVYNLILVVG